MSAVQYINVADFMQHLKDNNLVIVAKGDVELNNDILRANLLKRKSLSLTEIVNAQFFPVKDSESLRRWCLNGKFPEGSFFQLSNGKYKVLTSQIKKMIYG